MPTQPIPRTEVTRRGPVNDPPGRVFRRTCCFPFALGAVAGAVLGAGPGRPRMLGAQTVALPPVRSVTARRLAGPPPAIDGRLDDDAWRGPAARGAADPLGTPDLAAAAFITTVPVAGGVPQMRTEARVRYDDDALYVAVRAYDPRPDSILAPYPRRDNEITADWLFVEIDSRHDRRSGFSFGLNARGVQVDGTWSNDVDYDASWNGVWDGAARIDALGWTAEFRIPFSQLALPAGRAGTPVTLGFNVYRYVPRRGESSNSSPRPPIVAGVVSHFLPLVGLVLPPAARRVEVVPYVATRAAHAPPAAGDAASAALPRGGALLAGGDARVRLTPAFTLSGTVRPDFGQVEADPAVVNLTAFESYFPEQRPFFVESASLFAFHPVTATALGATGIGGFGVPFAWRDVDLSAESPFYSRRVGRAPHAGVLQDAALAGQPVRSIPAVTDVIGAAKLAGRTENGWSVGALGALTDRAVARVGDVGPVLAEPRTAYGVVRVARDFRAGRSTVGAIVTGTDRFGLNDPATSARPAADLLPRAATVAGVDARHRFGDGDAYEASGFVAASRAAGSAAAIRALAGDPTHALLRADRAAPFDTTRTELGGTAGEVRVAKLAGHWVWSATAHAVSSGFVSNDLGFQRNADWLLAVGAIGYQHYAPSRWFRKWSVALDELGAGWSTAGERRGAAGTATASATLHNEWGGSVRVGREGAGLSFDALRGGPAFLLPPRDVWAVSLHSDTRRPTQWTWSARGARERDDGGVLGFNTSLDARLTDRVRVALSPDLAWQRDPRHFVANAADSAACPGTALSCPVVAHLRQTTFSTTTRADLAVTAHATLQLYAQPLVARGAYDRYAAVVAPRAAAVDDRTRALASMPAGLADPSFGSRTARATAVWRWEYRPGSTLYAVFSQQRAAVVADPRWRPSAGLRALANDPAVNVLLVKASYWWQP